MKVEASSYTQKREAVATSDKKRIFKNEFPVSSIILTIVITMMAMVFASAGIPVEGVAIAAGIDRLVDMARTTMSVTGDASCAVVLQRFFNKKKSDDIE